MAEEKPCKNDISVVFKRLRSITSNKVCFDCGAKNPTWASVTYGVFICMDCSAVHRSLGVHLSFVRSTQLDTNWTWLQLRAMQVGGNSNALVFFQQHGCGSHDAQQKYNSRAAQLYREKLHNQAAAAMRLHGTKLHIDIPHVEVPASPDKKEPDFFQDIAEAHIYHKDTESSFNEFRNGSCLINTESNSNTSSNLEVSLEPLAATKSSEVKKSTIGGRKPVVVKKGLGGKKGLGAQKVSANFDAIEKEAEKLDRLREEAESKKESVDVRTEEQEQQMVSSVRLAYKDLSLEQKRTEEKLRQTNPQKAEQLERLGMGFGGGRGGVAHSAASDMKLITQENPSNNERNKNRYVDPDDDFEFLSFSSGPPKYGDSPFLSRDQSDRLNDVKAKESWLTNALERAPDRRPSADSAFSSSRETSGKARKSASTSSFSSSDEAQKKFGNAKGISSEQFFGGGRDCDFERKAMLTKFEGSSSISSDDLFGGDSSSRRSASASSSSYNAPNLYDIKEGVRDGVTKVAGRLSSIANGVMSSLQRK